MGNQTRITPCHLDICLSYLTLCEFSRLFLLVIILLGRGFFSIKFKLSQWVVRTFYPVLSLSIEGILLFSSSSNFKTEPSTEMIAPFLAGKKIGIPIAQPSYGTFSRLLLDLVLPWRAEPKTTLITPEQSNQYQELKYIQQVKKLPAKGTELLWKRKENPSSSAKQCD